MSVGPFRLLHLMAGYVCQKEVLLYLCHSTRESDRSACCISWLDTFAKKRYCCTSVVAHVTRNVPLAASPGCTFLPKRGTLYLCHSTRQSDRSACCISWLDTFDKKRYCCTSVVARITRNVPLAASLGWTFLPKRGTLYLCHYTRQSDSSACCTSWLGVIELSICMRVSF